MHTRLTQILTEWCTIKKWLAWNTFQWLFLVIASFLREWYTWLTGIRKNAETLQAWQFLQPWWNWNLFLCQIWKSLLLWRDTLPIAQMTGVFCTTKKWLSWFGCPLNTKGNILSPSRWYLFRHGHLSGNAISWPVFRSMLGFKDWILQVIPGTFTPVTVWKASG